MLHLFITANLRGDIRYLPRLATALQEGRRDLSERPLLLDVGGACDPESWICAATENRAPYIVLDGLGYTAAWVEAEAERQRLISAVQMRLLLPGESWSVTREDVRLTLQTGTEAEPRLAEGVLWLPQLPKGQFGHITLDGETLGFTLHTVPPNTRPDPTISGLVDFVEGEARYYQKKRGTET